MPDWWDEFLDKDHVPTFDFSGKTPHWTYDRHMEWLGKCVLPTFVKDLLVQILQGGNVDAYLNHLLDQGMSKLQPKDIDDLVTYSRQIQASDFCKTDNQFKFTKTVKQIGDRFTGMVSARIYDQRNKLKITQDDLQEIKLHDYEVFIKEHGISNNYFNLQGKGVIK